MAERTDWNAIGEGHSFEAWERSDLSIELFQAYGEASGDGNPMHTDEEFAQDLGYPTVFAQGMLIMAFAAKYVTDIAGVGNRPKVPLASRCAGPTDVDRLNRSEGRRGRRRVDDHIATGCGRDDPAVHIVIC